MLVGVNDRPGGRVFRGMAGWPKRAEERWGFSQGATDLMDSSDVGEDEEEGSSELNSESLDSSAEPK